MSKRIRKSYTFDDLTLVPKYSNIPTRTEPVLDTWITKNTKTKIPLIPANMDTVISPEMARVIIELGGFPIMHRFAPIGTQMEWVKEFKDNCYVSCGVGDDSVADAIILLRLGARGVCIDIAHGHSQVMIDTIRKIKQSVDGKEVIAGNVCTSTGYVDLVNAGADAVKVGIGGGAACTTRRVTGFGVPQMTAILDCAEMARCYSIPIIADGGIRNSRDVALALAAGASTCMVGSLFSKALESAAPKFVTYLEGDNAPNPLEEDTYAQENPFDPMLQISVKYRGQASSDFQRDFKGGLKEGTVPEGIAFMSPLTGTTKNVVNDLLGGLRSAYTYGGARTIKEFQRKAEFMEVSSESFNKESRPRPDGVIL